MQSHVCLASQGNLSEFVKVRPEARSYYELSAAKLKFNLPKPGFLDGVKSRVRCFAVWITRSCRYSIACFHTKLSSCFVSRTQ